MNNNLSHLSQNISESGTYFHNPYQDLNILSLLNSPNKQIVYENLNFFCYLQYLINQNRQLLFNINQNENHIYYNHISNNIINPSLNNIELKREIIPHNNIQLNSDGGMIVLSSQDIYFLNKKRNDINLSEKENGKINLKNGIDQHLILFKDTDKTNNSSNSDSTDSKRVSNAEIFLKEKSMHKNEVINKNKIEGNSFLSLDNKINKEEKKEKIKRRKKKKEKYSELLQDTILEHIGKSIKTNLTTVNDDIRENSLKGSVNQISNLYKKDISFKAGNILTTIESLSLKESFEEGQKLKEKIIKIKNHSKKKKYNLSIKNNNKILVSLKKDKSNETELNPKPTKVIFHGENYKSTTSSIDFMKYNFDFTIEEQYKTKKLITDYNSQHIDMIKLNTFDGIYSLNNQNLDEIESKWLREKFSGNNKELNKALNIIKDTFSGREIDVDEEKCLNILKGSNYNISNFLNRYEDKNLLLNK